jgi:hypothetical protein
VIDEFHTIQRRTFVGVYENVRVQVELDMRSGGRYRFAGDGVKQYAEKLREEIERRRLRFTPIDWDR